MGQKTATKIIEVSGELSLDTGQAFQHVDLVLTVERDLQPIGFTDEQYSLELTYNSLIPPDQLFIEESHKFPKLYNAALRHSNGILWLDKLLTTSKSGESHEAVVYDYRHDLQP